MRCRYALLGLVLLGCSSGPDGETVDPNAPACPPAFEEVSFLQTDGTSVELFVHGDTAYLSDSFGLRVVDIASPQSPAELTYFEQAMPILYFNDLAVQGDIAYIAGGIQGLTTLDVSSPSAPRYLNTWNDGMPDGQHDAVAIALVGDTAFTAEAMRGLHIYDVSDPSTPTELGSGDFHMSDTTDIAASGDLVVVDDGSEIVLVDVSDPSSPAVTTRYGDGLSPGSRGFFLRDELLFFGSAGSLVTLDISDPSSPALLSTTPLGDGIEDLFLDGDCLYVGHESGAFTAVDVKRPEEPIPSEHVDTFGVRNTMGIAKAGDYVVVASRDQGLRVYRETEPTE